MAGSLPPSDEIAQKKFIRNEDKLFVPKIKMKPDK